jgi:hypothetical protein
MACSNQQTTRLTITSNILLALLSTNVHAEERLYIRKNETFCDSSGVLCLHGSLTYRPNSRIVSLNARVQKQTGPGTLHIILSGNNRLDMFRRTEIKLTIRGTYSEIINHQMRPDAPDVPEWSIWSFDFESKDD